VSRSDTLSRTAKIFLDDGTAASLEEADEILSRYLLQIEVAPGIERSPTRQVMLLTIMNTASRAFLGGVHVRVHDDPTLTVAWGRHMTLRAAIEHFGGEVVDDLKSEHPTVVIGETGVAAPGIVLYPTWNGWTAGVTTDESTLLAEEHEFELAGVLAGGLAVSEAFQHLYGYAPAGRRTVGISLWRPDLDWRDPASVGPRCRFLPSTAWVLGLGHLGQAYCWAIGCLPYAEPGEVAIMLQDFDFIINANHSTSALAGADLVGERKTRVVAARLEEIGFRASITERRFDRNTKRVDDEPVLALAGFDKPEPRRDLDPDERGFNLVLDGGLGRGAEHYLDILIHSFPSSITTEEAFPTPSGGGDASAILEQPGYQDVIEQLVQSGRTQGEARCGAIEIAGRTVAAAFVGAVASALVLAEPLRVLHGGRRYGVVSVSLRAPEHADVAQISSAPLPIMPFTLSGDR
jgi:hypothetical protein